MVKRAQLLALGFSAAAIRHRLGEGRLHPKWRGVYAVGRPGLTREWIWMAAALTCATAGLTPLRFTHAQVAYEPGHVRATPAAVAARLG